MNKKDFYKKKIELIKNFLENNGNVSKLVQLQKESLDEIKKASALMQMKSDNKKSVIR